MKKYKFLLGVMVPTRKRVKLLKECLDSFNNKTIDKSLVEILLKIDSDDLETIQFAESYKSKIEIKIIISDRKNGYGSLHEHYNSLAKISESEFLIVFNDDIEMLTEGWEQHYIQYKDKWYIIGLRNYIYPSGKEREEIFVKYNGNPAIPHDFYNQLGSLSEHPMLDDWWVHVADAFNDEIEKWVDVEVWFKRPGGDHSFTEADSTFSEGREHINWRHHNSPELRKYIEDLYNYVKNYPERF